MGDVVDFTKYKKKRPVFNEWAIDWGVEDCTVYAPFIKQWSDYTHQEKLNALIEQRFGMPQFLEYVSKHRYYKQFDPDVMIDTYPMWVEKMLRDGKVK